MNARPDTNQDLRLLCTIPEVAAQLQVGRSTIYELIRTRQLDVVKIGRCTRIPSVSLQAFVLTLQKHSGRSTLVQRAVRETPTCSAARACQ